MKGRLVFVEHHCNWLNAFEAFFATLQCHKSFHTSAFAAIKVLDRAIADPNEEKILLVTDYSMHIMDGLELCKKYELFPNVTKVIFSNIIEDNLIKGALSDGTIDNYIKKDLDGALEVLYSYIEQQLLAS